MPFPQSVSQIVVIAATGFAALSTASPALGATEETLPRPQRFAMVGAPDLGMQEAAVLARLNAAADEPFFVEATPRGTSRSLYGGRYPWQRDNPAASADRFLAECGSLFGLGEATGHTTRAFGDRRVHVSFTRGGIAIEGASLRLILDGNALIGAVGDIPPMTVYRSPFTIDDETAAGHARIHVQTFRDHAGRNEPRAFSAESTPAFLSTPDGLVASWRVQLEGTPAGEAYVHFVDAGDGASLRTIDLVAHGSKGTYPFFGQGVPFKLGKATGNVYKTIDHAIAGIDKKATLKNWASKGVPLPADLAQGLLVSAHADIWDSNGNDPFAPNGQYLFNPFLTPDSFDATNTLYQVERFFSFVNKNLGPVDSDFSIPIIVNVDSSIPNAFFSPTTFPGDSHVVGFLSFHDLKLILDETADFSRDASVIDHEYVHAMLFYEGLAFNDLLDYPTRSVGEAIPDFFATTHQGEPVIGRYLDAALRGEFSRNLQDDDHFPETTLDAMSLTMTGLPQEHRNGEIFGSALADLLAVMDEKSALRRVMAGIPFMPNNMATVGFDPVTPINALEATSTYFGRCILGMLLSDPKGKHIGEVVGAATTRGILGEAQSEVLIAVNLEGFKKRKETFSAEFLADQKDHYYVFRASQGRKLKVKVTGEKGSSVLPDFTIVDDLGNPASVTHTKNKVSSKGGRVISENGILLNLPLSVNPSSSDPFYVITVTTPPLSSGRYTLTLDA